MKYIQNLIEEVSEYSIEELTQFLSNTIFKSDGISLIIAPLLFKSFLNSGIKSIIQNCYNDVNNRHISKYEILKHEILVDTAYKTFFDLLGKHQKILELDLNNDNFEYAYEVAEHISIAAMKQYQMEKVKVLGKFYGRQFYFGNTQWGDIHYIISLINELSFR